MPRAARLACRESDIDPEFPVHMLERGVNHRQVPIPQSRLRYRGLERLHLSCLRVEPDDLHLRHVAEIDPAFLIDIDLETALGDLADTVLRYGILEHFAGSGIELPDELGIEIRVPHVPLRVEHFVMRRCIWPRQVVYRVDHLGGLACRPRQCLQGEFERVRRAQVDRAEIFGEPARS